MASGICVLGLWCRAGGVSSQSGPLDVLELRASGNGDGGNDFRKNTNAFARVVGVGLVSDKPEAGRERAWTAACARVGKLPDGLGHVASAASGDGAARPRAPQRPSRGR